MFKHKGASSSADSIERDASDKLSQFFCKGCQKYFIYEEPATIVDIIM